MSDSDDTDVLLLIPPDLFIVQSSSDSDLSSDKCTKAGYANRKNGVISELVGHIQTLESRVSAIESKDNSLDTSILNNSVESHIHGCAYMKGRQTLPRTRFSISQTSSLQSTPVKPCKSLSVPSTPGGYLTSGHANSFRNDTKVGCRFSTATDANAINTNNHAQDKHDVLTSYCDTSVIPPASGGTGLLHVTDPPKKESCSSHSMSSVSNLPRTSIGQRHTKIIQEMELSEVDELLQEMEATELELSKRINSTSLHQYQKEYADSQLPSQNSNLSREQETISRRYSTTSRKLEYEPSGKESQHSDIFPNLCQKKCIDPFPNISLPSNDSFQLDETEKMISEFRTWDQSVQPVSKTAKQRLDELDSKKSIGSLTEKVLVKSDSNTLGTVTEQNTLNTDDINSLTINNVRSQPICKSIEITGTGNGLSKLSNIVPSRHLDTGILSCKTSQYSAHLQEDKEKYTTSSLTCSNQTSIHTDPHLRKSQRILSLSDFWDTNIHKSQEEMFRIKLEEEKLRREHCEHVIQELQKRLLEQQEKVAVAVRVDNEKNVLISQFHTAWLKLKQRVQTVEVEHESLQTNLRNVTEKHQSEVTEYQAQIKRCEGELSKALDLAAGYKEKSDSTIKEKVNLLKAHADELESYKSLVQEAENRYEQVKQEYNKLLEKNQQTEETLQCLQQELNKERLRGGEVRSEMGIIHKALDACEAELTVLKQEKENLQLKLKEEINRNAILEQKNSSLLASVDDAKKAEKLAKDESKSLAEEKEKIRIELQEVYQKQVDEVVKAKLQEFQTQLDTAESEFLEELKTRQQVIAECAARKIKDVIDKHRLEINLLEEKHKEEKRLCELQLAQVVQKSFMLEAQLNSQRTTKSQLAEQLHSVMQKQWQQALQIISGGNMDNMTPIQKINAEKIPDSKGPKKSENCCSKISQETVRLTSHLTEAKACQSTRARDDQDESLITLTSMEDTPLTSRKESKDDLRKYIKMIAEMQQTKDFPKFRENISSPPPVCREVPRKHYMKKELSIMSEDSVTWQPISEPSVHDVSEYLPISQKLTAKIDQSRGKPPWK